MCAYSTTHCHAAACAIGGRQLRYCCCSVDNINFDNNNSNDQFQFCV